MSISERKKKTAFGGYLFLSALACCALLAWDPEYKQGEPVQGTVVANIFQVGEPRNPQEQVQVRLPSGLLVNANVYPVSGHPYTVGTAADVTPYRSLIFSKRTYRAYMRTQAGP